MSKQRNPIPNDIATEVLFAHDRTCCVCRDRGKSVQIHHINEDPSNNDPANLSVLCLQCHDETQIRGGFGRKLNSDLVTKYRDEWVERVKRRRDIADEMALHKHVGEHSLSERMNEPFTIPLTHIEKMEPPIDYIYSLPKYKKELLEQAQPKWDTGITATMVQANYDYIDALRGILVTLAKFYSPAQFGDQTPQEYFSEIISSRFRWHRTIAEPQGPGTGGTIVNVMVGGAVMADVEQMVQDMVMALVDMDQSFDWKRWKIWWSGKKI